MIGSLLHVIRAEDIRKIIGGSSLTEPKFARQVIDTWLEMTTMGMFASAPPATTTTTTATQKPNAKHETES